MAILRLYISPPDPTWNWERPTGPPVSPASGDARATIFKHRNRDPDMTEIKNGDVVRIHYTGRLTDGTEFDSSAGREPLEFEFGAGQIIPGIEHNVSNMEVGEKQTVTVPAEEAYGPRDDARVQAIPRTAIPEDVAVDVGTRLQANTPDGQPVNLTVVDLDDSSVTVDANHPLAGRDLVFDLELVEVIAA
jgi:peptidylprolyl isomerase